MLSTDLPLTRANNDREIKGERSKAPLSVGVDVDDVLIPWYALAHLACVRAGITNGVEPTSWRPYEEYGCTDQQWYDALTVATLDGSLYLEHPPIGGAVQALARLKAAGHTVHIVTARGFFAHGHVIKAQTHQWFARYGIAHDTITFSRDKTIVRCDYFVDDNVGNVQALTAAGTTAYLVNRPWNADHDHELRVDHVAQFVDAVLGES